MRKRWWREEEKQTYLDADLLHKSSMVPQDGQVQRSRRVNVVSKQQITLIHNTTRNQLRGTPHAFGSLGLLVEQHQSCCHMSCPMRWILLMATQQGAHHLLDELVHDLHFALAF
jgi:hypothetical protein